VRICPRWKDEHQAQAVPFGVSSRRGRGGSRTRGAAVAGREGLRCFRVVSASLVAVSLRLGRLEGIRTSLIPSARSASMRMRLPGTASAHTRRFAQSSPPNFQSAGAGPAWFVVDRKIPGQQLRAPLGLAVASEDSPGRSGITGNLRIRGKFRQARVSRHSIALAVVGSHAGSTLSKPQDAPSVGSRQIYSLLRAIAGSTAIVRHGPRPGHLLRATRARRSRITVDVRSDVCNPFANRETSRWDRSRARSLSSQAIFQHRVAGGRGCYESTRLCPTGAVQRRGLRFRRHGCPAGAVA